MQIGVAVSSGLTCQKSEPGEKKELDTLGFPTNYNSPI
jgi:hypothetical protein